MGVFKICVEISATKELPEDLWICSEGETPFKQKVVYEWKPKICLLCSSFFHLDMACPLLKASVPVSSNLIHKNSSRHVGGSSVDGDWIVVQRRLKGKKIVRSPTKNSDSGWSKDHLKTSSWRVKEVSTMETSVQSVLETNLFFSPSSENRDIVLPGSNNSLILFTVNHCSDEVRHSPHITPVIPATACPVGGKFNNALSENILATSSVIPALAAVIPSTGEAATIGKNFDNASMSFACPVEGESKFFYVIFATACPEDPLISESENRLVGFHLTELVPIGRVSEPPSAPCLSAGNPGLQPLKPGKVCTNADILKEPVSSLGWEITVRRPSLCFESMPFPPTSIPLETELVSQPVPSLLTVTNLNNLSFDPNPSSPILSQPLSIPCITHSQPTPTILPISPSTRTIPTLAENKDCEDDVMSFPPGFTPTKEELITLRELMKEGVSLVPPEHQTDFLKSVDMAEDGEILDFFHERFKDSTPAESDTNFLTFKNIC